MSGRRVWTTAVMLAASRLLAGCVSTTDLNDDTTTPPAATPAPAPSTSSPSVTADGDYTVSSRSTATMPFPGSLTTSSRGSCSSPRGPDGISEGEATVSGLVEAGEQYMIDFDCSPSTALVTFEWAPAPAAGEEPANPVGPTSVTQDCGTPGPIEGIAYDADTLVQLKMFPDELNAGWAVLRPRGCQTFASTAQAAPLRSLAGCWATVTVRNRRECVPRGPG